MKTKAVTNILFAIALISLLSSLDRGYLVANIVVVILLASSAAVLYLHDKYTNRVWRTLAKWLDLNLTLTIAGFGICMTGKSLMASGGVLFWLGLVIALAGFVLLGGSIGQNIGTVIRAIRVRMKSTAC